MGNRFGFKDFVQIALLVVLIVTVWLSMKQREREFVLLQTLQTQTREQTTDLSDIRRLLSRGGGAPVATTATTTNPTDAGLASAKGDPFKYIHEAQARPDYARGDWFIDNFGTKVPKLTPLISSDAYQAVVENRVLEQLCYQDPVTLEFLPLLATDWKVEDKSEAWDAYVKAEVAKGRPRPDVIDDEKTPSAIDVTFKLRAGVTFSDGEPFSADDVIWTFKWIMNPRVQSPRQKAYYQKIRSIEKVGDLEVVFHFREPYFEFFDLAAGLQAMPEHFFGKFTPEQFNENPGLLMGTGPYRLERPDGWRPNDKIELVRNARYWGEPGPFEKLIYDQVETDRASLTQFRNGETDIFAATPEQYDSMKKDESILAKAQPYEVESSLSGYGYIAWNQKRAGNVTRFADPRVRQAMTLLTDRDSICKQVLLGYATTATGPFSKLGKGQFAPEISPMPFDPEQAKKLLAEAGFEDRNKDGVVEDAAGVPFAFKFTYPSNNETIQRVMLFLKDSYARVGVKAELDPVDWPIMIGKLDNRDFDAITLRWTGGPETDIYQMFHSDQIKDNGDNFMSYSNPKLDALIDEARSTVNEEKRMPLWQECHRILHADQPYTFLYNTKGLAFIDKRVQNVKPSRLGLNYIGRLNMPNPWYVPLAQQKRGK